MHKERQIGSSIVLKRSGDRTPGLGCLGTTHKME